MCQNVLVVTTQKQANAYAVCTGVQTAYPVSTVLLARVLYDCSLGPVGPLALMGSMRTVACVPSAICHVVRVWVHVGTSAPRAHKDGDLPPESAILSVHKVSTKPSAVVGTVTITVVNATDQAHSIASPVRRDSCLTVDCVWSASAHSITIVAVGPVNHATRRVEHARALVNSVAQDVRDR